MPQSPDELDRQIREKQEALVRLDRQMRDMIASLRERLTQADMADIETLLKLQESYHVMQTTVLRFKEERRMLTQER
jgi:hypothetical protein